MMNGNQNPSQVHASLSNISRRSSASTNTSMGQRKSSSKRLCDGQPPRKNSPASFTGAAEQRSVRKLRLSKALTIAESTSVLDACKRMTSRRVAAALLTDPSTMLSGIITDKDVTARVVAEGLKPEETPCYKVMTRNPQFVSIDTPAVESLEKMVEGRFRHLPVVEKGEVVALLDIAKCLYDAISKLEKAAEKGSAIAAAVEGVNKDFGDVENTFVEMLRERMFRPSLSTIIAEDSRAVTVSLYDSVSCAAKKMRDHRVNSVLVMTGIKLKGILTSKDILSRVIAQNLPAEATSVEKVMTPNPECVNVDTKILDALHIMHDGKFLHLPVADRDGSILACVDVLQLTHAAMALVGSANNDSTNSMMQRFWDSAFALDHTGTEDDTRSDLSAGLESDALGYPSLNLGSMFAFKLWDLKGRVHRFNCSTESLSELLKLVVQRLGDDVDESRTPQLMYQDDEGDKVLLLTDSDLSTAVNQARIAGQKAIKLYTYNQDLVIQKETLPNEVSELPSLELLERHERSLLYPGIVSSLALLAGLGVLVYLRKPST